MAREAQTTTHRFAPVPSRVSFVEQEQQILELWRELDVFRRSIEERPADRIFSFFEGPPTANGNPGIHHVLTRVFKDLIPRYRTMRGDRVPRKGGWDTHGLPVELEVERQLGLSSKQEIEDYGVEAFNRRCRESVFGYVAEWERLTDRIAFWIDMQDAYVTLSPDYIETLWWIFRRLWDHGLVHRDFRVTPHCPRCETSLSSHEIAQGYREDTPDPGVTVRFTITKGSLAVLDRRSGANLGADEAVSLLAWTTTPWTLSGNTALAVLPSATYALVEHDGERLILADRLVDAVVDGEAEVLASFPGSALVGLEYEPLYEASDWEGVETLVFVDGRTQRAKAGEPLPARRVIASDEVTTEEGTGVLHVAPAFGEVDYQLGRSEGLRFLQPVRSDGTLIGGPADGAFAKTGDRAIMEDLEARGLLFKRETIRHTYPFCWRCETPVLYYAKPSWYIRTTAVRDRLVEHNRDIHWVPGHLQSGRFGEWLEGNVDWAVSRERYWGTPLPLWVCEHCQRVDCVGSFDELRSRAVANTAQALETPDGFDPHRPFVDRVELSCPDCNGLMRRTPEVADAWFDSGAMPYAQWHYPFENEDVFDERFPADFICEGVDQTRGWFYTLHALATLLHRTEDVPEGIAYRNVISLGHIVDADGKKMSKSLGNVLDPWSVIEAHGADATRWYMYTVSPAGNTKRISVDLVGESGRRFMSTLWNTYSFFVTYANIAGFDPAAPPPEAPARTELDRWIRSELHRTVQRVTAGLDDYEPADAARPIEQFVEELSNWYVRRNRRRFWKSEDDADRHAALHTLYECLVTVARLMAPFMPFLAEALYQNLVAGKLADAPDSVHLDAWPEADASAIDERLSAEMAIVQRMVSLGRGARARAQVKVRQPLGKAVLVPRSASERAALERLADQVAEELNVKAVEVVEDAGDRMAYTLRPNLPVLGPRLGQDVGRLRAAIAQADAGEIVRRMRAGEAIEIGGFPLSAADLLVHVEPAEGWAAAEESGYAVLIDTRVTPELESEGMARELVRRLQDLRRDAGLEVTDRIHVRYRGDAAIAGVFERHGAYIAQETLALSIEPGEMEDAAAATEARIDATDVGLSLRRA